jgi:hypothetical protein
MASWRYEINLAVHECQKVVPGAWARREVAGIVDLLEGNRRRDR